MFTLKLHLLLIPWVILLNAKIKSVAIYEQIPIFITM